MSKGKQKEASFFKKYVLIFWTLVVGAPLSLILLMWAVSLGLLGELPSFEELENPKSNLATEIYSSDGQLLGKYFQENRTNVKFEDLSPYLVEALVSTEDERFYEHSGIDFRGTLRAVIYMGSKGGASTITQQLSKMLFSSTPKSKLERIKQKLQELIIAVRLEKRYTKDEIITMYLNKLDFVNNAVGIKSAANVYFNTQPDQLKLEEAATLVGMAKNPSLFNPVRRVDTTLHRRNVVLSQMKRNNHITEAVFDSLKQKELILDYKLVDHKEGIATHFREILRLELKTLFEEKNADGEYKIKKNGDGMPYNIYKDGLKIYTTIDSRMQRYAEWAVTEHLSKQLQKDLFNDLKKRSDDKRPFDWRVSKDEVKMILNTAVQRTSRYRILAGKECANCGRRGRFVERKKENGREYFECQAEDCQYVSRAIPEDSIDVVFNTPVRTTVFSWKGEIDTIISPLDSIKYYKSFLQSGLMSMDPHTGYVKAWVGGIDSKHFSYDHVKQSRRQVGSTFKPFVYALAIQNGYSPCTEVPNVKITFKKGEFGLPEDWTPKNNDGVYGCNVSLKYGLANSMNTITAYIMRQFGPHAVAKFAKDLGIESNLAPVPSLCLGVADLSVYEMVGAMSTFANKGVWLQPTIITRIEDKNGNVIVDFIPNSREVMNEETSYAMIELMKGVVDGVYNKCRGDKDGYYKIGTGVRLRGSETTSRPYAGIRNPVAGKTGTTQNNSDGWFMGITPDLVTGVWVGAEDRSVRFSRTYYGQGANTSLPIWAYYMKKIYADSTIKISQGDFEKPTQKIEIELDCDKYKKDQEKPYDSIDEDDFG